MTKPTKTDAEKRQAQMFNSGIFRSNQEKTMNTKNKSIDDALEKILVSAGFLGASQTLHGTPECMMAAMRDAHERDILGALAGVVARPI